MSRHNRRASGTFLSAVNASPVRCGSDRLRTSGGSVDMDLGLTKSMLAAALVASGLVACGKVHADHAAIGAAGAAGGAAASSVSAAGTTAGGSANVGGAIQAARCNIDLDASCSEFELGSPRALLLRPDEYRNSIATLFGVAVDVTAVLPGPFGPYTVDSREQITV